MALKRQNVRYCSVLLLLFVASITSSEAQSLRLGEKIPAINVVSDIDVEQRAATSNYVCLMFVHSKSAPCIESIATFKGLSSLYPDDMLTVLITPESEGDATDMLLEFADDKTIVAYDNDYRTYEVFDIKYVPFGIIYRTSTRKILWFGTIGQLNDELLKTTLK